jgi:hypothetical protein
MLRAGEAFFAISPFLLALLLYAVWFRRVPTRRAVAVICVAEAIVAVATIWQGTSEGLRPHQHYVPAQLDGGTVVEGHGG